MPQFPLGEWLPDQPQIALPGLIEATNVLPTATGYTTFSSAREVGSLDALANDCVGAGSGTTQKGDIYTIAGSSSELKVAWNTAGFSDASPSGSELSTFDTSSGQWTFDQYGNRLIAIAPGVAPLSVDTSSAKPSTSNRFAALSADCSKARTGCVHKEFLILGNIVGQGSSASAIGTQTAGLHWSAIGNPTSWPQVATSAAIDAQSDYQILDGSGGEITAVVSAGDYVAVFRERQTWRMDYVGGSSFFSFRLVDPARGAMLPSSAVAVNGVVYFPSVEGFMALDGQNLHSIGEEKVDRTWRSLMDFENTKHVCGAHNPETHSIYWTVSTGSGIPTKIFGYRYDMDRWFLIEDQPTQWVFNTFSINLAGNLETPPLNTQNMDSYNVDLDSLGASDSTSALAIFNTNKKIATYTNASSPLTGTITTGDFESGHPSRAVLNYLRPTYEGQGSVSGNAAGRVSPVGPVTYKPLTAVESTGVLASQATNRVGGRYLRARFSTTGGEIENFSGFDADLRSVGKR